MTAGEAQHTDHEQRIGALESRMTTVENRLDAHDLIITRLNEIFRYSRNTWLVIKFVAGPVGLLAGILTIASYLGWIG